MSLFLVFSILYYNESILLHFARLWLVLTGFGDNTFKNDVVNTSKRRRNFPIDLSTWLFIVKLLSLISQYYQVRSLKREAFRVL